MYVYMHVPLTSLITESQPGTAPVEVMIRRSGINHIGGTQL